VEEVAERFPGALIEDASDEIHESRIKVVIEDATMREWFTFLLESGWHCASLVFLFSVRTEKKESEFGKFFLDWVEKSKADAREVR
jgi:hypothetical protein